MKKKIRSTLLVFSYLIFGLFCTTLCSCRGKATKAGIEILEKGIKYGGDDAARYITKEINKSSSDYDQVTDDEEYSLDEYDYGLTEGQVVYSEESGDYFFVDENGESYYIVIDEDGDPYFVDDEGNTHYIQVTE